MENKYSSEIQFISKKIKLLREEKNMTQQALASFCDIDVRTIQRIETGHYNMTLNVFFAIAEALEISTSELIKI